MAETMDLDLCGEHQFKKAGQDNYRYGRLHKKTVGPEQAVRLQGEGCSGE